MENVQNELDCSGMVRFKDSEKEKIDKRCKNERAGEGDRGGERESNKKKKEGGGSQEGETRRERKEVKYE